MAPDEEVSIAGFDRNPGKVWVWDWHETMRALVVEVNPHPTPLSEFADYSIRAGASEFFPALCATLARSA